MKDYIYTFLILLLCYLCLSCTRHVYVPVENTRTEYRDIYTRDSIHTRDSIRLMLKGDTVYLEKYKTIYRDRLIRDSIFLQDTIKVPYPVERIVYKNKTSRLQNIFISIGFVTILFFSIYIAKRKF